MSVSDLKVDSSAVFVMSAHLCLKDMTDLLILTYSLYTELHMNLTAAVRFLSDDDE